MEQMDEQREAVPTSTVVGVGCFTGFVGAFGGGMIAVFLGKIVGSIRGCEPPEGVPACNWHVFAGAGMLIGLVVVPTVSIMRLKGRGSI